MAEKDRLMWIMGQYVMSAVGTVISRAFDKNSKAEYVENPLLSQSIKEKQQEKELESMTEDDKRIATENLFLSLQIIGSNFNLSHEKGDSE